MPTAKWANRRAHFVSNLDALEWASTRTAHCTKYNLAALREYRTKTFLNNCRDRARKESFESLRRFSRSARRLDRAARRSQVRNASALLYEEKRRATLANARVRFECVLTTSRHATNPQDCLRKDHFTKMR